MGSDTMDALDALEAAYEEEQSGLESSALAVASPTGLAPSPEVPGVFALAGLLFERARSFIPKGIRDPAELVAVILTGQEMGMGAMTSMRTLYIVNGKVSLSSEGMLAFAIKAGVKPTWVKSTTEVARLRLEREGMEPFEVEWTMDDAKRAGLAGKGVWKSYPRAMLRNRCVSEGVKAYCPDALLGAYVPEEMSSIGYAATWDPSAFTDDPFEDDDDVVDVEEL